ncbi:hypothetical protein BD410DRAFT_780278 [Rickenella mellea]|uniref:Uncharacterized protein n=1 Tax=Rickenella mellea TaxID=50990 RepID=A0A4V3AZN3_9AGAM|nr:hypothetical protein BD410DRAFT_780278 [Rickenella mellea]
MHTPSNSLGLEFDKDSTASPSPANENTSDPVTTGTDIAEGQSSENVEANTSVATEDAKEKSKPYVNPDRFMTGGTQREKLSSEELDARMDKIREKNEKIKQRRLAVQADEDAFKASQEIERKKEADNRKIQQAINQNREQNALRKMEKVGHREWDSGKPSRDGEAQGDDTRRQTRGGGENKTARRREGKPSRGRGERNEGTAAAPTAS